MWCSGATGVHRDGFSGWIVLSFLVCFRVCRSAVAQCLCHSRILLLLAACWVWAVSVA
jgi:hypothetical protein